MMLPFIYTGTRNHDFRVVTSKMLKDVPRAVELRFEEVARTMIDADDSQLVEPSWTLVKIDGYVLWGMSVLNTIIGDKCLDDDKRPVRGFFGFISDASISRLPYSIAYFKELYATYVTPIWDTYEQTEQINCQIPPIYSDEFITKSSLLKDDINVDLGRCLIFPYGSDCKGLIEAVFSSFEDCSIATNIHKKSRCIEFGKDKLSFMNVVGASDSGIRGIQDIKVYVKKEPIMINGDPDKEDVNLVEGSSCTQCGKPVFGDDVMCSECKDKSQKEKHLKYGLYGFIAIVCLVLIFKGPSIWEAILSPKHAHEFVDHKDEIESPETSYVNKTNSFLRTRKSEFPIQDADIDQPFYIQYQSSSNLSEVQPSEGWIQILTLKDEYSREGVIKFVCEKLNQGARDGKIRLINEEGEVVYIKIHQTISNQAGDQYNLKGPANKRDNPTTSGLQKIILGDENSTPPSPNIEEKENTETGTSAEGTN